MDYNRIIKKAEIENVCPKCGNFDSANYQTIDKDILLVQCLMCAEIIQYDEEGHIINHHSPKE